MGVVALYQIDQSKFFRVPFAFNEFHVSYSFLKLQITHSPHKIQDHKNKLFTVID
jgi:hypothetical protein